MTGLSTSLPTRELPRRSRGLILGGMWLRWLTWRDACELDRQLAQGEDPMQSDELSLRVGQLGTAKTRTRLACALRAAVELADRQPDTLRGPSILRTEIRANRQLLIELADRLSSSWPLGVEGLAMTSLLIYDAPSPLYHEDVGRSLTVTALEALVALDRGHRTASTH